MIYTEEQSRIIEFLTMERERVEAFKNQNPFVIYAVGSSVVEALLTRIQHYQQKEKDHGLDEFDKEVLHITEENFFIMKESYVPAWYDTI